MGIDLLQLLIRELILGVLLGKQLKIGFGLFRPAEAIVEDAGVFDTGGFLDHAQVAD